MALLGGLSRKAAGELVASGKVRVDHLVVTTPSRTLRLGQYLGIERPPPDPHLLSGDASVAFDVVYEDEHLIVVDKPAGLVVHRGAGHKTGTLVEGLVARYPDLLRLSGSGPGGAYSGGAGPRVAGPGVAGSDTGAGRPGIVHRLDKGTSGLLVVARTPAAMASLAKQFREHTAQREYVALVWGGLQSSSGVIDAPIGRSERQPTKMAVKAGGRFARTSYKVIERFDSPTAATLIEATLETGRTHQVRVHLAAIGHPVVGDDRYGKRRLAWPAPAAAPEGGRLFLHARRLVLEHPSGEYREWASPLPGDLMRTLEALRSARS